jgi:tetratricopeptide (TPR) repeat protein
VLFRSDVAHNNIASLLVERGRLDEAISHYTAALVAGSGAETHNHLSPAIIENSLGNVLAEKGEVNSALVHYRNAVELRPDFSDARSNLSVMLLRTGDLARAITEYERVVVTPPEDGISHRRLAWLLVKANRSREAVVHYRRAVELNPNSVDGLNALAWILATSNDPAVRNATEALALAQQANHLTGQKDPVVLRIVAASCAGLGQFTEAATTAERALSLVPNEGLLACSLEDEMNLYRSLAVQTTTARSGSSSN